MIPPFSVLYYGGPGSGKTRAAVSSFWDFEKREQIRNGRWCLFGRESNPAIRAKLPPELVHVFPSPKTEPMKFLKDFDRWVNEVYKSAGKEGALESIVFDGFTEFSVIHDRGYNDPSDEKWGGWRALKAAVIDLVQALDPEALNAYILGTARVDERRKGTFNKKLDAVQGADPEWMDHKYYPAMDGWSRINLAHYFNFVLYMDQDVERMKVGGNLRRIPIHKTYMLPDGDFWVKNCWEEEWVKAGMDAELPINASFDVMLAELTKAIEYKKEK